MRLCVLALLILMAPASAETLSPAPLPDDEQREPGPPAEQPDIQLQPTFFAQPAPDFSDGFLPGSSSENADEEDRQSTPGVEITVPLP